MMTRPWLAVPLYASWLFIACFPAWAQTPRAATQHPNLNGIWQALNEANWDLEGHNARPSPVVAIGCLGCHAWRTGCGRRR